MGTTAEPSHFESRTARIVLRIFLVLCGIGLFVVAGIVGALIVLYWAI